MKNKRLYLVRIPMRKQKHSDMLVSNIEGPTAAITVPMCSKID